MDATHCETFEEIENALYKTVSHHFKDHKRVDMIVDRYFKDNLKGNLRDEKGVGSRLLFDGSTKQPPKFHSDFLKNSDNKNELGYCLAKKIIELHLNPNEILVLTYEDTILVTNSAVLNENNIPTYTPFIKRSTEINLVCRFGFGNVKYYSMILQSLLDHYKTIFSRVFWL